MKINAVNFECLVVVAFSVLSKNVKILKYFIYHLIVESKMWFFEEREGGGGQSEGKLKSLETNKIYCQRI